MVQLGPRLEIVEFNENFNINGKKKRGFWTSRAVMQSNFIDEKYKFDNSLLAAVPDSYGLNLLITTHDYFPYRENGQRYIEIIVTRVSNNIWTTLQKVKIPVNSSGARFDHSFYISRKLFLIQNDPVCYNCRGQKIDCLSYLVCYDQLTSGTTSQTIIEVDYKEESSKQMQIFPFSQYLFNHMQILCR